VSKAAADLSGLVFGRLTAVDRAQPFGKYASPYWNCTCSCGRLVIIRGYQLTAGKSQSCGCLRGSEPKHGLREHRVYRIWQSMLNRCNNPNTDGYSRYGGNGIVVCSEWSEFTNFIKDMGLPNPDQSIERLNNDLGYCKLNCVWATATEQARNRKSTLWVTFNGKTCSLAEHVEDVKGDYGKVLRRLRKGWTPEEALTTPFTFGMG